MNFAEVLKLVKEAQADPSKIYIIYVERHGEVCMEDYTPEPGDDEAPMRLQERVLKPSFDVLYFDGPNNRLMAFGEEINPDDAKAISEALDSAVAEYKRFYTERAKQFGPSAWPNPAA